MRQFNFVACLVVSTMFAAEVREPGAPAGWTTESSRDEIRPKFSYDSKGGRSGTGSFIIETDTRDGLDGYWKRSYPVEGSKHYQFRAYRKATGVEWPQQCAVITVQWFDQAGKRVLDDRKLVDRYLTKYTPTTPLEYPVEGATGKDGWTELTGLWQAPSGREASDCRVARTLGREGAHAMERHRVPPD